MHAYKSLVNYAVKLGLTVSVWDGDAWQVERSSNKKDIFAAIESVEESVLIFRDGNKKVGVALIDPSLDEEESVVDYVNIEWMRLWAKSYYS